jgi:hypothetical protein
MDERQIAHAGDEFKSRVREVVAFLLTDFGFAPAVDESVKYSHRLTFRNAARNQLVEILNAFHGYDYGFELTIRPASGPRLLDGRNMVYFKLKEDQEPGFSFLADAARELRAFLETEHGAEQR